MARMARMGRRGRLERWVFRSRVRRYVEIFEAQPPDYRRQMSWRVTSAKREQTRAKRLLQQIEASAVDVRFA